MSLLGLEFDDLLNLSSSDVIEKFRKMIEKKFKEPVNTFTFFHQSGHNEVVVKTPTKKDVIKGSMMNFLIRKGLIKMLGKNIQFKTIELVYSPEQIYLVIHTDQGIETKKL